MNNGDNDKAANVDLAAVGLRGPRVEVTLDRKPEGRIGRCLRTVYTWAVAIIILVGIFPLLLGGAWFMFRGEDSAAEILERIFRIERSPEPGSAVDLPNGERIVMRWVPAGDTWIGGGKRRVSRGFWVGKEPVTQAQWESVMGGNPSLSRHGPDHPVDGVSWEDCRAFCEKAGAGLRLPSTAERTAAYRVNGPWFINEWCADWHGDDPKTLDPTGPETGDARVVLAEFGEFICASPETRLAGLGFRVCRFGEAPAEAEEGAWAAWRDAWLGWNPWVRSGVYGVLMVLLAWGLLKAWVAWDDWAASRKRPCRKGLLTLPGGAKMAMAWCEPGTGGDMASGGRGFWIGERPVTLAEWESVMGGVDATDMGAMENPSPLGEPTGVKVTWEGCRDFCRKAGVRLPGVSQWEHGRAYAEMLPSLDWMAKCVEDDALGGEIWWEWCALKKEGKGGNWVRLGFHTADIGNGPDSLLRATSVRLGYHGERIGRKRCTHLPFRVCCPEAGAPLDGSWAEEEPPTPEGDGRGAGWRGPGRPRASRGRAKRARRG